METTTNLIEMAISNFEHIARECDLLTTGNLSHQAATIKGIASRNAQYLRENDHTSPEGIQRTIITRAQLAERGYTDAYTMSDERLGEIAEGILEALGLDEHFSEALENSYWGFNPISAYYFHKTRLLTAYIGTKQVFQETVEEEDESDYWARIDYGGPKLALNLFHLYQGKYDEPYQLSVYLVKGGLADTSHSLPVTFRDFRPRFKIGDKVRFTEEAIRHSVENFQLDELWAQTHREKEYEVLGFTASPEYNHIVVTVRHTAQDDTQDIAEHNLTPD